MERESLTTPLFYELLRDSMYEDLFMHNDTDCLSYEHGIYATLECRTLHDDTLVINRSAYDSLIIEANSKGLIPVYICSTPNGIWLFNMELLPLNVGEFDVSVDMYAGTPILAWYPEYESEYEFLNEKIASEFSFDKTVELIDAELFDEEWEEEMLSPSENWESLDGEIS